MLQAQKSFCTVHDPETLSAFLHEANLLQAFESWSGRSLTWEDAGELPRGAALPKRLYSTRI